MKKNTLSILAEMDLTECGGFQKSHAIYALVIILISILTAFTEVHSESQEITIGPSLTVKILDNSVLVKGLRIDPDLQMLDNPPRYVLDFKGEALKKTFFQEVNGNQHIVAVRAASHGDVIRLVFDLRSMPERIDNARHAGRFELRFKSANSEPLTPQVSLQNKLPEDHQISSARSVKSNEAKEAIKEPVQIAVPASSETTAITKEPAKLPAPSSLTTKVTENNAAIPPTVTDISPPASSPESADSQQIEMKFSLSSLIVSFTAGSRPIQDLTVKSRSKSPLFITATAEEIENPGFENQSSRPTKDLLVSPRRFELANESQERLVRFVLSGTQAEKDKIFRVNIVPDSEPFTPERISRGLQNITAGVSVLVIALPPNPQAKLHSVWEDNQVTLENEGNTNIYIDKAQACNPVSCKNLPVKRIYAGAKWKIALENIKSLELFKTVGKETEKIILKKTSK